MYGFGLFYEKFIPKLLLKPDMSPIEHANSIIDTYVHPTKKATISLIKTAALENLKANIDERVCACVRIVDSNGSIVGFNPGSETKNKVVSDYQDSIYYRSPDGTTQIILPAGLADFTTVVDGGNMEEEKESYTLDIKIVDNEEVLFEETLDYPISLFSEHSIPIQLTDESISIGELTVRDNTLETEPEPEPQPEPEEEPKKPGGIPGFGSESILIGVAISILVMWLLLRRFSS